MEAGRATLAVAKAIVCAAAIVAVYLISTVRLDRGFVQTEGTPTAGLIAAGISWLLVVWVLLYRDQCREDVIAPVEVGRYVHERLAGSEFALIDAVGHCPNLSAPEALIAVMREYLLP
jgi:hypothetical protein